MLQGMARLEVEVTNLSAKAGKGNLNWKTSTSAFQLSLSYISIVIVYQQRTIPPISFEFSTFLVN